VGLLVGCGKCAGDCDFMIANNSRLEEAVFDHLQKGHGCKTRANRISVTIKGGRGGVITNRSFEC